MAEFQNWQQTILEGIGAPVTVENIAFLSTWQKAEQGGAKNNPLNTTQPAAGATPYNSFGPQGRYHVWNYVSPSQGAQATVQTLQNGRYPAIVAALRTGNAPAAIATGKVPKQQVVSQVRTWGTDGFASLIELKGGGDSLVSRIANFDYAGVIPGVDAARDAAGNVTGAAGSVVDAGQAVAGFVGAVTDPRNLLRAGEVIAGAGLMAMGLFLLAKQIGLAAPPVPALVRRGAEQAPVIDDETLYLEGVADERRRQGKPLAAKRVDRAGAGVETQTHSSRTGRRILDPDTEPIPF